MLKVLLPVDGSESSLRAIEKAIEFGITKNVEMHVVTVALPVHTTPSKNPYIPSDMVESLRKASKEAAADILEAAAEKVCSLNGNCASKEMLEGEPAEEIIKYAQEIDADLIVMGSRGLSTFGRLLLGSVSQKVLHNAHCSVLTVR